MCNIAVMHRCEAHATCLGSRLTTESARAADRSGGSVAAAPRARAECDIDQPPGLLLHTTDRVCPNEL